MQQGGSEKHGGDNGIRGGGVGILRVGHVDGLAQGARRNDKAGAKSVTQGDQRGQSHGRLGRGEDVRSAARKARMRT